MGNNIEYEIDEKDNRMYPVCFVIDFLFYFFIENTNKSCLFLLLFLGSLLYSDSNVHDKCNMI